MDPLYRELSWRHLKKFLPAQRPAWAADLGCGTGWFGARLLKAGLATLFLDPSGKMIGRAQETAEAIRRANDEVRFVQAGLEDMGVLRGRALLAVLAADLGLPGSGKPIWD